MADNEGVKSYMRVSDHGRRFLVGTVGFNDCVEETCWQPLDVETSRDGGADWVAIARDQVVSTCATASSVFAGYPKVPSMESSPLTITASFSTSTPLPRLCSLSSDVGELAQRAARIRTAAERCGCIVKRFLAMSCQRGPEKKPVDLNQIVRAALELVGYGIRSAGIRVTADLAPTCRCSAPIPTSSAKSSPTWFSMHSMR